MAFPEAAIARMRRYGPALSRALRFKPLRRAAQRLVERRVKGPDAEVRRSARSHLWARAADAAGHGAEAWLITPEGYRLTAISAVRCAEKVLAGGVKGATTPARAFGADFILEIPETRRLDVPSEATA